jgi:hypothetical protein
MQERGRGRSRYPDISLLSRISRTFLRKEDYKIYENTADSELKGTW